MRLLVELEAEHGLIDATAGSLRAWARAFALREAKAEDGHAYLRFFRVWADQFHHAREEGVLFAALTRDASLPGDRGPIAVILADHAELAGMLRELEACIESGAAERAMAVATAYARRLGHHIDAENSVLFPESEARLRRHGIRELEGREPTPDELEARREGEAMLARFPPLQDAEVFRGEGCILCPAYGVSCEGLEREWWSESEWEEIHDRLTGM